MLRFVRGMNHETWLEKAARLRTHLDALPDGADQQITIAIWLRQEFSDEAVEDTATLALFPSDAAMR